MKAGTRMLMPAVAAVAVVCASEARADVTLPPVNLGDSTFQDGMAGPGGLFQQTLSAYRADRSRDGGGHRNASSPDVASVALLTQVSYLSERRVLGAYWGGEVIVPVVHARVTPAAGSALRATGVGDLFISPLILQWPETRLAGRPFWQRVNLNMTLPTGRHGRPARLDLGSNVWQFNPHYAFTWEASPEWEISGRLHYLRTSANHDPGIETGASKIQAGHAVHLNSALSRSVNENVRIGGSMYFLIQFGEDRVDGARQSGRERVLGAGPALAWKRGRTSLHAAAYVEALAKDRAEGTRISLRYATNF